MHRSFQTIKRYLTSIVQPVQKPLGRWQISHMELTKDSQIHRNINRKIDLANHDSCFCKTVSSCIENE